MYLQPKGFSLYFLAPITVDLETITPTPTILTYWTFNSNEAIYILNWNFTLRKFVGSNLVCPTLVNFLTCYNARFFLMAMNLEGLASKKLSFLIILFCDKTLAARLWTELFIFRFSNFKIEYQSFILLIRISI